MESWRKGSVRFGDADDLCFRFWIRRLRCRAWKEVLFSQVMRDLYQGLPVLWVAWTNRAEDNAHNPKLRALSSVLHGLSFLH